MQQIIPLEEVLKQHKALVGDKASALAAMSRAGLNVPPGICVTTEAYDAYLNATGLRERISLEINRKSFDEMRWEETVSYTHLTLPTN